MATRKFTKHFDYTTGSGMKMTSYDPKGGDDKDGTYEVSEAVAKAADAAGVTGTKPAAEPAKPAAK
jgi:hypothetical protein